MLVKFEYAGEDVAPVFAKMKELSADIKTTEQELETVEAEYKTLMLSLPNLPDDDLVGGGKENNKEIRRFGTPHVFDFEPKNHVDICTALGLIDYARGVKLSGNGFWIYKGMGARLEWALLNYFIDTHIADGYELLLVPSDSFSFSGYVRIAYCVGTDMINRSLPAFRALAAEYGLK